MNNLNYYVSDGYYFVETSGDPYMCQIYDNNNISPSNPVARVWEISDKLFLFVSETDNPIEVSDTIIKYPYTNEILNTITSTITAKLTKNKDNDGRFKKIISIKYDKDESQSYYECIKFQLEKSGLLKDRAIFISIDRDGKVFDEIRIYITRKCKDVPSITV